MTRAKQPASLPYLPQTPWDGSEPKKPRPGAGCALSPDGRWALAMPLLGLRSGSSLSRLDPETCSSPARTVETYQLAAELSPGRPSDRVVGAEPAIRSGTWIQELPGGTPRPVTPRATDHDPRRTMGGRPRPGPQAHALPAAGPASQEGGNPGARAGGRAVERGWPDTVRQQLYRGPPLDVFGIERRVWKRGGCADLRVPDPAGVGVATFVVTRDGRSYAYVYERLLDELYLVEGLKLERGEGGRAFVRGRFVLHEGQRAGRRRPEGLDRDWPDGLGRIGSWRSSALRNGSLQGARPSPRARRGDQGAAEGVRGDADPSAGSGSSRARSRDDRLRRFEQEARHRRRADHPNILGACSTSGRARARRIPCHGAARRDHPRERLTRARCPPGR